MRNRSLRFLLAAAFAAVLPSLALASSHSEAPGTARDRLADDTDAYMFVAKDARNAVTFVGNWVPLLEPNGGPNFYSFDEQVAYYLNIDNVGDCQDHIRYEFEFKSTRQNDNTFLYNTGVVTSLDDPDLNVRQFYTLTRYDNGTPTVLLTDAPVAPNFVGPVSMPDYHRLATAAIQRLDDGTRVFVGPRDDPFFVDLGATFDLLTIRKPPGNRGKGVDGVSNYNVLSIVVQVPKTRLTKDGREPSADRNNHILGLYDSAERFQTTTINGDGTRTGSGPQVQVSRLGMPLVNEVVIPLGKKDLFNASKPTGDGQFLSFVTNPELAGLLTALYNIQTPPSPRNDLVAIFLTGIPDLNQPANGTACEMLRLNMTIAPAHKPCRFGVLAGDVAGFPNGRRLSDDVVDIAERVVAGATPFTPTFNVPPNNQLGDGIDFNDRPFLSSFPYVAPPHDPLSRRGHRRQDSDLRECVVGNGGDDDDDDDDDLRMPVDETDEAAPSAAGISLVGGNPSSDMALEFSVPVDAYVTLKVYDVQGRMLRTLVDQPAGAGTFRATWNGLRDDGGVAGKGIYFVRLTTDGQVAGTRKIVLD
ncbi:MAG TPA: DUF4331 family protein [Candidatus Limnocylindria bacterium]|nr:DUF4331 family protein [Candidatus Limnocylindria bacterium]